MLKSGAGIDRRWKGSSTTAASASEDRVSRLKVVAFMLMKVVGGWTGRTTAAGLLEAGQRGSQARTGAG